MKRYVIDIDGVCADFCSAFKTLLENMSGTSPDVRFDTWNWDKTYFPGHSEKAWHHVRSTNPNWWLSLKPLKGFHKLSFLANKDELEPVFLTNRNFKSSERITSIWLQEQGLRSPIVLSVRDKASVIKGIQIDGIIDDSPENITSALRAVGAGPDSPSIYMVEYPYNAEHHDNQYINVVSDLDEFLTKEGF